MALQNGRILVLRMVMNRAPKSIRLLMHGYDPVLLETRCSILKQAGFERCTVAARPRSLKSFFKSEAEPYDLLVVCHSVPRNERESIAFLAAAHQTPVYQIETFIEPEKLVAEVARAVTRLQKSWALG